MEKLLLSVLICSGAIGADVTIYSPEVFQVELNMYEKAVPLRIPVKSIQDIQNGLHRAYAVSVSLPLVSVGRWMDNVTEAYFELNQMEEDEFRRKVKDLNSGYRRTDYLVYDVRMRSGEEEYAAVLISRKDGTQVWTKGMNLSAAVFEKGDSNQWLRTSLPPNHWTHRIPLLNPDSLRKMIEVGSIIVDEHNVPYFLDKDMKNSFEQVSFVEEDSIQD